MTGDKTMAVWVKTSFTGFHRWKDASAEVAYLRDWHRHVFHVRVMVEVTHDNRDVEFHLLKGKVDQYLKEDYADQHFEASCEQIAVNLLDRFNAALVEVSEDGENGATVIRRKECQPAEVEPKPSRVSLAEMIRRVNENSVKSAEAFLESMKRFQSSQGVTSKTQDDAKKARWKNIAEDKTTGVFFGLECEGPPEGRGLPVMFVPGSVGPMGVIRKYAAVMKAAAEVGVAEYLVNNLRVYYGAGNDRKCSPDTLFQIFHFVPPERVTLETTSIPEDDPVLKDPITLVLTGGQPINGLATNPKVKARVFHKIVDALQGRITWVGTREPGVSDGVCYESSLDDPEYGNDNSDVGPFVARLKLMQEQNCLPT